MNFENTFLGPRSIQVCHLMSKTPLTSIDCLRGLPRPIQRGCWPPRWLRWLAPFSLAAPSSLAVAMGGRRDERPARRCGRPGRGQLARRRRSHTVRRGAEAAEQGLAGRARDNGGGLELSHSLSSVRLRAAAASVLLPSPARPPPTTRTTGPCRHPLLPPPHAPRACAARIVGAVGELQPRRGQRAARRGPERLPELWRHRADPRWWPRL